MLCCRLFNVSQKARVSLDSTERVGSNHAIQTRSFVLKVNSQWSWGWAEGHSNLSIDLVTMSWEIQSGCMKVELSAPCRVFTSLTNVELSMLTAHSTARLCKRVEKKKIADQTFYSAGGMRIDRWPEDVRIVRQNEMGAERVGREGGSGEEGGLRYCSQKVCQRFWDGLLEESDRCVTHIHARTCYYTGWPTFNMMEMIIQKLLSSLSLNSRSYWLQQQAGLSSETCVGKFDLV